jgi:hypothetical protein
MMYAVQIDGDGHYGLATEHQGVRKQLSGISASEDPTTPDVIVLKIENQTDGASDLFDVSLWINPTALVAEDLPTPHLTISGSEAFAVERNLAWVNWKPGNTQVDSFKLATAYADFGIGVVITDPVIVVKNGPITLEDGTALHFGASVTGIPVTKSLTILNEGAQSLGLTDITIDGSEAGDFSVGALPVSSLEPGESTSITVSYTPSHYGDSNATLHIKNNSVGDLASYDLTLAGTGLPPISVKQGSSLVSDGSSLNTIAVLGATSGKKLTLANDGLAPLTLGQITIDGPDASDFSVTPPGTATLNFGESTTFIVRFTPSDLEPKSATIHIANSAAGSVNPFDITINGTGHLLGSTIVVTEPFDYNVGVFTQAGSPASNWVAEMGGNSGIGWGSNNWISYSPNENLRFGISTGGHTGTFADSTNLNGRSEDYRGRNLDSLIHTGPDGSVIWQSITMSRSGSGLAGQFTSKNNYGGMLYAVQLNADGYYSIRTGHPNLFTETSQIQASTDPTRPDLIVLKIENQVNGSSDLFDVSMWINPTASQEVDLPPPDVQILGTPPFAGMRNIGSYDWRPGNTQIDNLIMAGDYADLQIEEPSAGYGDWADTNAGAQASHEDYDNDGVPNGVEFFMGETGSSFTTNRGFQSGTITWPKNPAFTGTYEVQYSVDLEHWIPVSVDDVNVADGNLIFDPSNLSPVDGKLFVRLMVSPQ